MGTSSLWLGGESNGHVSSTEIRLLGNVVELRFTSAERNGERPKPD